MTRIDFHSNVPDKVLYACRLVRKVRAARCKIVLQVNDRAQLARLDEALWTFSEHDFLPHVRAGDPLAARTPVILSDSDEAELPHHEILINLSDRPPAHFARFERLLEVIGTDAADTEAGRERFRYYKQRGYPLNHFVAETV